MWAAGGLGVRYGVLHNTTGGLSVLVSTPSTYLAYVLDDKISFQFLTAFSVFDAMSLDGHFLAFQRVIFPFSIGSSNPRRK